MAASLKPQRISFSLPGYVAISPMAKIPGRLVAQVADEVLRYAAG